MEILHIFSQNVHAADHFYVNFDTQFSFLSKCYEIHWHFKYQTLSSNTCQNVLRFLLIQKLIEKGSNSVTGKVQWGIFLLQGNLKCVFKPPFNRNGRVLCNVRYKVWNIPFEREILPFQCASLYGLPDFYHSCFLAVHVNTENKVL